MWKKNNRRSGSIAGYSGIDMVSSCNKPAEWYGGFTLLEVMVAVAILGLVLVSVIGLGSRSANHVVLAEHMTTATLLAKRIMTETLADRQILPQEENGAFEEDAFKDYSWKKSITISEVMEDIVVAEIRVVVSWKEGEREEGVELVTYE